MSKVVALLKRLFVENWKMKLIAFIFAFVLWSFVIAENNPSKTKMFKDIPVTFTAADELKQKGLTSTVPLNELLSTATSVTTQAPAAALQFLNENMIQLTVDLSSINDVGTYTLPVKGKTTLTQGSISAVEPATVTITVEEIITKEVPVDVQITGDQSDTLYYGEPLVEPQNVKVTGSRSNVEQVAKAVCTIDVSKMTEPTTASYSVTYVKADDTSLPGNLFSGSTSVIVELPVYPVKEVSIDTEAVKSAVKGLAPGYQITNIMLEPQTVKIAGKQEDIDKITSLTLEPITLENATADVTAEAAVPLPEGVVATVPAKVQVKLTISQPEIEKVYAGKKIAYKNLGEGLSVQIEPAAIDISVYGTQSAYDSFTSSMLKPFVDLSGLGRGVHTGIPVKFENEPDLGVRAVPAVAAVTVTIS